MVLGDSLWSNTSTCISELAPRWVLEVVGDFRRARRRPPSGSDYPAKYRIIRPNPFFVHETHSRNTQVRIIRPRVGSSETVQWQKVLFGRIIRPMDGSSDRGHNGNPKPKFSGGGRIIRRWVGSSDQHRPSVLVKCVEKCKKITKMQNQLC